MCLVCGAAGQGSGSGSGCGVRWTWESGLNSRHSHTSEGTVSGLSSLQLIDPLAMEKQFNWI